MDIVFLTSEFLEAIRDPKPSLMIGIKNRAWYLSVFKIEASKNNLAKKCAPKLLKKKSERLG